MEAIRLEPQDAVCGFIALEAAIAAGEPKIIIALLMLYLVCEVALAILIMQVLQSLQYERI